MAAVAFFTPTSFSLRFEEKANITTNAAPKRFAIALSFPGERRKVVEEVAELLAARFGRERVLYDRFHRAEFAQPDLDVYLPKLYRTESE